VVLPTGLGKTVIAALVARARLAEFELGKVVVLAPTKPLALQHSLAFKQLAGVQGEDLCIFTGEADPARRGRMWRRARYVFATPQAVLNDLRMGRVDFFDVVLMVFDEAHRSVRDYSYTELARAYRSRASKPRILALTASPGGYAQRIDEIRKNLYIERVEARAEEDEDVRPYVAPVTIEGVRVPLPREYHRILSSMRAIFDEKVAGVADAGFSLGAHPSKTALLRARGAMVARLKASGGSGDERISRALLSQAQAVAVMHGIELLETQGVSVLRKYLRGLRERPKGPASELLRDSRWRWIESRAEEAEGAGYPKLEKLVQVLKDQFARKKGSRVIAFTQYRDTIDEIVERLADAGIRAARFVGQASKAGDRGMTQRQQTELLAQFMQGRFSVLVSSSIGEEGLHVPDVDLVVFFEAIPSEIRSIQRKGRTGRTRPGRVVVLLARGTVDEENYRVSLKREKSMRAIVSALAANGRTSWEGAGNS
jgi:Fanconi anemia group M protein